jgi:hypothetical protein
MTAHDKFIELCAFATSGNLSQEEKRALREHLLICDECRQAMTQFEAAIDVGVPALAPELATKSPEENPFWSVEKAEAVFFKRLAEEDGSSRRNTAEQGLPSAIEHRSGFRRRFDQGQLWLPLAAGVLLCATLGILAYRMGIHRGVDVARLEEVTRQAGPVVANETLEAAARDRDVANAKLRERDKAVVEFRRQIERRSAEITLLQAAQSNQLLAQESSDEEKKQLAEERDRLARQLAAQQATLQASEKKLSTLEQRRSEEIIHSASLEAKVFELSRAAKERDGTIDQQQELLAHDRDIRELMGARDLYVAEVYDIARTGETQKAFGRVFYTKEKSLIFYAYDLDGAPGWKNAHTFQAWGTHGGDRGQAFNLGMFYEDNASKKRWVLKFTEKKTLEEIDAVFVTIEPSGGSEKPSGKPFLFANLRMNANHP